MPLSPKEEVRWKWQGPEGPIERKAFSMEPYVRKAWKCTHNLLARYQFSSFIRSSSYCWRLRTKTNEVSMMYKDRKCWLKFPSRIKYKISIERTSLLHLLKYWILSFGYLFVVLCFRLIENDVYLLDVFSYIWDFNWKYKEALISDVACWPSMRMSDCLRRG